ncbi:hypothetical protein KUCAC02_007081 [Chaenocephalus aceratus]|nr:hypothetical protein KUCAC02_007081 [Chaenocephalus aceratus]
MHHSGIYPKVREVIDLDARSCSQEQVSLDRKCVTMLKPRTVGNSSSYLQQALEEVHSEEWARHTVEYLADCELHKERSTMTQSDVAVYMSPPRFSPDL